MARTAKTDEAIQRLETQSSAVPELSLSSYEIENFSEAEDAIKEIRDKYQAWSETLAQKVSDVFNEIESSDNPADATQLREHLKEAQNKLQKLDDEYAEATTVADIFGQFQNGDIYDESAVVTEDIINAAYELHHHLANVPADIE